MGFVSFLEDLQKVRDDIHHHRDELTKSSGSKNIVDIENILQVHTRMMIILESRIDNILAVVTDPQLDLYEENSRLNQMVVDLRRETRRLEDEIKLRDREIEKLKDREKDRKTLKDAMSGVRPLANRR